MGSENLLTCKSPIIRRATLSDIASIARVHVDSWCETYKNIIPQSYLESLKYVDRAQMWAKHIPRKDKKAGTFVVTGSDGDVVGFCDFGPAREHEHGIGGEIYALYLIERYQKQGLGKALFEATINSFVKFGHRSFYLWVLADNKTRDFYLHMGGEYLKSQIVEIGGIHLKEDLIVFHLGK